MKFLLTTVIGLIFAPIASGADSIFEDSKPLPSNQNAPTQAPKRSVPSPAPQRAKPVTPEPEPAPASTPVPDAQPQPIVPSVAENPDADTLDSLGTRTRDAITQARFLSKKYVQRAEQAVDDSLAANHDYAAAKAQAERMKTKLDDARMADSGVPSEMKMALSSTYNTASSRAKSIRDAALASSVAYKEAKELEKSLTPIQVQAGGPTEEESRRKEIAMAIASHNLVEGMTYDEACRAAKGQGVLFSQADGQKIYHWDVRTQVGSHQVVGESHQSINGAGARVQYVTVLDYQVTGYVEGVFVSNKLVTFRKVSRGVE